MKRIFLEDAISENVTITGKNAHHLAYSLRAKKGDKIVAVDTLGMTAVIELVDFDKETIRAKCVSEIEKVNPVEMIKFDSEEEKMIKKHITLAECLPKQNKFDTVVEKATELGVDKIVPLISDRTIARPGSLRAQNKLERWGRIAKETAEQSARDTLPEIGAIRELSDWLKEISHTLGYFHNVGKSKKFDGKGKLLIFCYENETEVTLQNILREYKNCDCDKNIILLIGPEGGFTEHEAREITSYGGVSVSLGKRILKTDTAALSAIAAVQYEFA